MLTPSIKICGIKDPIMAQTATALGARFIGVVLFKQSIRYVDLNTAADIVAATQAAGGQAVGVFVDTKAPTMQAICQDLKIEIVQLHGPIARAEQHLLPDHLQRIYAIAIDHNGKPEPAALAGCKYLNQQRDYLLLDNAKAGSGQVFPWQALQFDLIGWRYFLAGGLNVDNVTQAMKTLTPDVLDVSSGVEQPRGQKNLAKITEFIQTVRQYHASNQ